MADLILVIGAFLAAGIAFFVAGDQRRKRISETETRNQAIATQKRIDDAFSDRDDSPTAARDRLRDRAKR